jgi:hypothetical protein
MIFAFHVTLNYYEDFLHCDCIHSSVTVIQHCPPISQIVLKNFIKISLIIKECPEKFR